MIEQSSVDLNDMLRASLFVREKTLAHVHSMQPRSKKLYAIFSRFAAIPKRDRRADVFLTVA